VTVASDSVVINPQAPIANWFGVGGRADRLARPETLEQLRQCLELDPTLRVLGDGANLLVADEGVRELVVSLAQGVFSAFSIGSPDQRGMVTVSAGAGVNLPKLINETARQGLTGLENLAGIPASVGGAVMMNAGGKYGSTGDYIATIHALDRATRQEITLKRAQVEFGYRHCSLTRMNLVLTRVDFRLRVADAATVREKLKEVMAYKKTTQPMAERSAGCCFKNPTLTQDLPGIATTGTRVSAGMLIDQAGCKGLTIGSATVSDRHANFITVREGTASGAKAADVLAVMREVRRRVHAKFGVTLEPEVVIWGATL
jgi:UDP-N-acetylmuramate dehydrogenase